MEEDMKKTLLVTFVILFITANAPACIFIAPTFHKKNPTPVASVPRNNIVHTKESSKKSIRNSSEGEQRTLMEINKLLLSVVRKVFDENIEW